MFSFSEVIGSLETTASSARFEITAASFSLHPVLAKIKEIIRKTALNFSQNPSFPFVIIVPYFYLGINYL